MAANRSETAGDNRGGFPFCSLSGSAIKPVGAEDAANLPYPYFHPGAGGAGGHALEMARTTLHLLHDRAHHRAGLVLLRQPAVPRLYRTYADLAGIGYGVVANQPAGRKPALGYRPPE